MKSHENITSLGELSLQVISNVLACSFEHAWIMLESPADHLSNQVRVGKPFGVEASFHGGILNWYSVDMETF
ncbi:hypothetical protein M5K25_021011 [Dendrobium thyrsiflorum]|uniref:Uncharacterized protein n=1 Tax=Dendrobium thyrsiflorum TaxID=117978 RepID=A0ABD0UID8_DENTH